VRFEKHYTREEARSLLPRINSWLEQLQKLQQALIPQEKTLQELACTGAELGGEIVNNWVRSLADFRSILLEFQRRQIQIKDLDRGLIDFPAIVGGREVFLCWEKGEKDVEFWHELDSGYSGREPL
jgi:hypothetical protein